MNTNHKPLRKPTEAEDRRIERDDYIKLICFECDYFHHVKDRFVFGYCSKHEKSVNMTTQCCGQFLRGTIQDCHFNDKPIPSKTLYEKWVDTLICPECGGKNFEIEVEERNNISDCICKLYTRFICCEMCGFTFARCEPIDFINNERKRLFEKYKDRIKLSDMEKAVIPYIA